MTWSVDRPRTDNEMRVKASTKWWTVSSDDGFQRGYVEADTKEEAQRIAAALNLVASVSSEAAPPREPSATASGPWQFKRGLPKRAPSPSEHPEDTHYWIVNAPTFGQALILFSEAQACAVCDALNRVDGVSVVPPEPAP